VSDGGGFGDEEEYAFSLFSLREKKFERSLEKSWKGIMTQV
jgi:hypothetical protein